MSYDLLGWVPGSKAKRLQSLVDRQYYRSTNPDVAAAGADPFQHFMQSGWREGRNPSRSFNTLYYRDKNLADVDVNPLVHYVEIGRAAALRTAPANEDDFLAVQRPMAAPLFDANHYRAQVGHLNDDPLTHYLSIGWRDGRSPSAHFDVSRYNAHHAFLAGLNVSPLYHFASQARLHALKERSSSVSRKTNVSIREVRMTIEPEFDRSYYGRAHRDVAKSGAEPLAHYIDHGWREGRNPNVLFDSAYYLSANPDVVESGLNPFYHYLTIGRAEGRRGNPVGTRLYPPLVAPPQAAWDEVAAAADTKRADYVVVMPIYKGFGETLAAIHAVLAAPQRTRFALHVVNDLSPDASLDQAVDDLAAKGLFSYAKNETNIGFVKTVNRALRLFPDKHVVLLNSDAVVSGDWLDRIAAHAAADPTIATITPMSNNATICSYPRTNDNNIIELECPAAELDRMAATCNAGRVSDLPTGVGFCFYMSRASRGALGIFDETAFGRGYGEENDFCLRAAKAGFRNVLAEDIFVYHAGEISFGEFVAEEYAPGQAALLAKHPDYPLRVQQYLTADTSEPARMRLDLYRLARRAGPRTIVFVSHALSGGIKTHIERMETSLRAADVNVVHLTVGVGNRWSIQIRSDSTTAPFCPNLRPVAFNQIKPLLAEFFGWLAPLAIHVHSLVGLDWVATAAFLGLVRDLRLPYFFTLHDYSVVCHRNDLVKPDGHYCGLPDVDICVGCVGSDRTYPEALDPHVRRATYADFLQGATAVFAPSEDVKSRLAAADVRCRVLVRPHDDSAVAMTPSPRPPPETAVIDIVTLGAIGSHKGSRVILNLARDAKARALPIRFHIIGYSDVTQELRAAGVTESGRYATDQEASDRVRAIRPAAIFLPSIWPETFCYALSLAFDLEVPPVVFDLGAQADRVRAANFGFILPYALIDDVHGLNDQLMRLSFADMVAPARPRMGRYFDVLRDYYDMPVPMHR